MPQSTSITVSSAQEFLEQIKTLGNVPDQLYNVMFTDNYQIGAPVNMNEIIKHLIAGVKQASYVAIEPQKGTLLTKGIAAALFNNMPNDDFCMFMDYACVYLYLSNDVDKRNMILLGATRRLITAIKQSAFESDIQWFYQYLLRLELSLTINEQQENTNQTRFDWRANMSTLWYELAQKAGNNNDVRNLADSITFANHSLEYSDNDNTAKKIKNYIQQQTVSLQKNSLCITESRTEAWFSIVMKLSSLHWFRGVTPDFKDVATLQACLTRFRSSCKHNGESIPQGYTGTDTALDLNMRNEISSFLKMSENRVDDILNFFTLGYFDAVQWMKKDQETSLYALSISHVNRCLAVIGRSRGNILQYLLLKQVFITSFDNNKFYCSGSFNDDDKTAIVHTLAKSKDDYVILLQQALVNHFEFLVDDVHQGLIDIAKNSSQPNRQLLLEQLTTRFENLWSALLDIQRSSNNDSIKSLFIPSTFATKTYALKKIIAIIQCLNPELKQASDFNKNWSNIHSIDKLIYIFEKWITPGEHRKNIIKYDRSEADSLRIIPRLALCCVKGAFDNKLTVLKKTITIDGNSENAASKQCEISIFLFGDKSKLNFNGLRLVAEHCPTNTLKLLKHFDMENTLLPCSSSEYDDIFSAVLLNDGYDNFLIKFYKYYNENFHLLCRICNLTSVLNKFFKKDQFQTFEIQHQLLTKLYQGSKPNTSGNLNERFSLNMLDGSQYVKDLFMGIYKTPATKAIFIQVCFTRWQEIADETKNSKAESSESSSIWELASSLWVSKEPPQHELQITAIKEVYAELRSDNKDDSNLDELITRDYMTLEKAAKSEIDAKLNPTYIDSLCG